MNFYLQIKIYLNNFKKISAKEETAKFEATLEINDQLTNSFNFLNNFNSIVPNDINNTNHKSTSIEQFRTDKRKSFDHSMQLSNMTINDIFEDKPNLVNLNSIDKSKRIINENINNIIKN